MYAIGGGRVVAAEMNRKILYTAYSRTDHARTQDRKGDARTQERKGITHGHRTEKVEI